MPKPSLTEPFDLSGPWLIRPDPGDRGLAEAWFRSVRDWDQERTMRVPGAWQHVLGADYHGIAWLARIGRVPRKWQTALTPDHRLRLRFDSVATDATVFVNGIEVGRHVGDYVPFEFDITEAVAAADPDHNLVIAVRVDEIRGSRPPPGETTERGHITKGFHDVLSLQHGGIWGDVTLRATARRAIIPDGIRVIADAERRRIKVRIELEGEGGGETLSVTLGDGTDRAVKAGVEVLSADIGVWEQEIDLDDPAGLIFWSPQARAQEQSNDVQPASTPAQARHQVRVWSPEGPHLYELFVGLSTSLREPPESTDYLSPEMREFVRKDLIHELHRLHFGFRTVSTGGPNNSHILLNGKPLLLRGVLHWGHEPDHIAPAPTPDQVRAEFARLKEMGFNCVCLCMWYPPRHYYDIADEMGMLIWQEHPVWKSPMEEELIPEYQAMFEKFFRRDRNHPSVVIVSGSCEHERIHPDLAAWWWKRAKEENPDRLVQIQTAFIGWTNPDQTDLHDEHVYESSGRWVKFCEDLAPTLAELPPKPFVMGETIIGTSWVDVAAVRAAVEGQKSPEAEESPKSSVLSPESRRGRARYSKRTHDPQDPGPRTQDSGPPQHSPGTPHFPAPWWMPKGLAECEQFERLISQRWGPETLARFKTNADRLNLEQRKFQAEVLRTVPQLGGWVMNQIRDVPQARLGFMDDLGRWRFAREHLRAWLADAVILLRTPDHRRGFAGGQALTCELGISNYAPSPIETRIALRIAANGHERDVESPVVHAAPGQIAWVPISLDLPTVEHPTRLSITAVAPGLPSNWWDLWVFPPVGDVPEHTVRLDGLAFSRKDLEPEFDERCYSSGWGMKVRSWKQVLPFPEAVLFKCPPWRFDAPLPPGTRLIVTHKLTRSVVEFLERGGRVLLLANKSPGGLGTKFVNLWGQVPLIIDRGTPLRGASSKSPPADSDAAWVSDLLHHDLTRRYTRAIPTEDLGIADSIDPIVRLVFTHDRGVPKVMDTAFAARVGGGGGVLLVTSLDHTEDSGRYLLQVFLEWLASEEAPRAQLDVATLRRWVQPSESRA